VNIRNSRWRWLIIAVILVSAVAIALIGSFRPNRNVTLTDLNNVEELRNNFNRDMGKTRLLLLLSPT
jgi:hypothetical protein